MRVTYPPTRPFLYYFNSLCIYDMIEYSSVVFMFNVYNNQCHLHLLCFFERLYDSHNHNNRKKVNNIKIKYSRTSQKASCISVIGPKLWNNLHSDQQCSKSISRFKTHYRRLLLQSYETPGLNITQRNNVLCIVCHACLTSLYFNCILNASYQNYYTTV